VDFGAIPVGVRSEPSIVTVRNDGDEEAANLAVRLVDGATDQFLTTTTCGSTLAPSATCTVAVVFAPIRAGASTTKLTIGGFPGAEVSVPLTGVGVLMSGLTFDPLTKDFDVTSVGSASPQASFILTNTGDAKTGILKLDLLGSGADAFVVDSDSCTSFELAAHVSCSVIVHFAPLATGLISATLGASATPGGVTAVTLSGVAVPTAFARPEASPRDGAGSRDRAKNAGR
jgi:hypothetical protein